MQKKWIAVLFILHNEAQSSHYQIILKQKEEQSSHLSLIHKISSPDLKQRKPNRLMFFPCPASVSILLFSIKNDQSFKRVMWWLPFGYGGMSRWRGWPASQGLGRGIEIHKNCFIDRLAFNWPHRIGLSRWHNGNKVLAYQDSGPLEWNSHWKTAEGFPCSDWQCHHKVLYNRQSYPLSSSLCHSSFLSS